MPAKTEVSQHNPLQISEVLDARTLAARWGVPVSWIREQTRSRASDPIPHVRLGRYRRFEWNSPALLSWFAKRRR
jgi:hypothetical protein